MVNTIPEADKYEMAMLKRLEMSHNEVINLLEQRNIEISKEEISNIMRVW